MSQRGSFSNVGAASYRRMSMAPTTGLRVKLAPTMFAPARMTLGSTAAYSRPTARLRLSWGLNITTRKVVSIAFLVVYLCGLGWYEYTQFVSNEWVTKENKQPALTFLGLSSISARLFQYVLVLVFIPLARNNFSPIPYLLGSSFEYLIAVHRISADVAIGLGTLHGITTVIYYALLKDPIKNLKPLVTERNKFMGIVALAAFLVLRMLTLKRFRNRMGHYWFHITHGILSTIAMIALSFHYRVGKMWMLCAIPLALWAFDALWRLYNTVKGRASVVGRISLKKSHCVVIDMEMKDFAFSPGQWVSICFPAVSRVEFHPVSVMASSVASALSRAQGDTIQEDGEIGGIGPLRLRVLVRDHGDWSKKVVATPYDALVAGGAIVQGPYGRLMIPVEKSPYIVIVGGGSGLPSALGELQSVVLGRTAPSRPAHMIMPYKVWLLASAQDRDIFLPYQEDIREMMTMQNIAIKLYETGPFSKPYTIETRPPLDGGVELSIPVDCGLPNMREFFTDVARDAKQFKVERVGVITVGPPGMQEALIKVCAALNQEYNGMFTVAQKPHSWFY